MHSEAAKTGAKFKFVDLGSIGQSGVVNGSNSFFSGGINGNPFKQFQKSKLGDLFVKSKFAFGKPDGSDCATFLAVLGTYGVKLSDFNSNGVLTESHETAGKNKFLNSASTLMQDLTNISNKAITCGSNPCALDTDKDGTNDCQDLCPNDKNKIAPGNCGCGVLESSGCGVVILPVNSYVNLSQNQVLSNTFLVKTLAYDGNYGTTHGDGLKQINYQIFDANDLSTVLDFFPITSAPYYWSLNTSNYPNGDYQIRSGAVSLDAGETKWVVQNIKINNPITGAEKEETGFAISIYPNPVERYVTIEGDVDSWEVKNSLGKVVLDGNGSTVDLESVENGVLFLQVNQQSFKIIKR